MCPSDQHREPPAAERQAGGGGTVTPLFPLLLLQTMRDMDRPEESLEDEDFTISMPRRFGLSDVVGRQIHRFQGEVKRRQRQDVAVVEDLIRLVIRRPDSAEIFREAGRRVAEQEWRERAAPLRKSLRLMPRRLALRIAHRAARRLLRQLVGDGRLQLEQRSLGMQITNSLTARADPTGSACTFFAGVLEELLTRYTNRDYRVLHTRCEARRAEVCEWTVRVGSA